jgi:ATP-binding cassette subfamily C (CFTR/MRP) protein 1
MFGVIYGVFAFFRALTLAISVPRMSETIHESMLSNLLFSSLNEFFDRVPLGRILNRLSKDLNVVDTNLPVLFGNFMVFLFFLLGNIVVILYCTSIWIVVPIMAFIFSVLALKNYYMKPSN